MKIQVGAAALFFFTMFCVATPAQTGAPVSAANHPYVRPDASTRQRRWLMNMFGPFAIAGDLLSAGISTWHNKPPEWGPSWNGFGKRFGSELGKGIIKNTTAFGLEEAFKLDSHYYRSKKRDPGSRLRNAIVSSFTARTPRGKRVVGFPRIAGSYTAALVANNTWDPKRLTMRDAFRQGTWEVAADLLANLITEFFHR